MTLPQLVAPPPTGSTPFEVALLSQKPDSATVAELLPLSRDLEDQGVRATEPTVLLTAFQSREHFDEATRIRYNNLADHAILTATFAEGMPLAPGPAHPRAARCRPTIR